MTSILAFSQCQVFHFYAGECEADIIQAGFVSDNDKVSLFAMPSKKHGTVVRGFIIPYLLTASKEDLIAFSLKHKGRKVSQTALSFRFVGVVRTVGYMAERTRKRLSEKLLKQRKE